LASTTSVIVDATSHHSLLDTTTPICVLATLHHPHTTPLTLSPSYQQREQPWWHNTTEGWEDQWGEQRWGWGWAQWPPIPKNGTCLEFNTHTHTNYPFPLCFQPLQRDEGSSHCVKTLPTPHPPTRHVKHACLGMFYVSGCLLLHPSLTNMRRRGIHVTGRGKPSLSHLFKFIGRDGEGLPSPLCLQVLFNATRGETLPVVSAWLYLSQWGGEMSVWCDKAPNTKSVPIWAYSWYLCPLHLSRHVKCAQIGTFYMSGVVSNTKHQKHARLGFKLAHAPPGGKIVYIFY